MSGAAGMPWKTGERGGSAKDLARACVDAGDPGLVRSIKEACGDEDKKVRNTAIKVLSLVAAEQPEWLSAEVAFFRSHLTSEQRIFRWAAMDALGHLAAAGCPGVGGKADLEAFEAALPDASMVTAAHGVANLLRVAAGHPRRQVAILATLRGIGSYPREADCREVLKGKVVDGIGDLGGALTEKGRADSAAWLREVANEDGRAGQKARRALKRLRIPPKT